MSPSAAGDEEPHRGRHCVAARVAIVMLGLAGALCAFACLVGLFFEMADFGAPEDDPRPWYVALYGVGLILSFVAPVAANVWLFRRPWWWMFVAAALGGALALATIVGVD